MTASNWQSYGPWSSASISCRSRGMLLFFWVFTLVWCLISAIVAAQVVPDYFETGEKVALIGLVFPVIGLLLLAWSIHQTLAWRRFGETRLQMDPYPGAIGGQVGGTLEIRLPHDPAFQFQVTLSCFYSYNSGSGKDRKRSERLVWQRQGFAHTRPHRGLTRLSILFDVDEGLPASERPSGGDYHLWRLLVTAKLPGIDFNRSYELPVFPSGERARYLSELSTAHKAAEQQREQLIEQVLDLRQIPGGVELYYPAFRHWGSKLAAIICGAVFFTAGLVIGWHEGAGLFAFIFGLIGAALLLVGLYSLLVSLHVRMDSQGVHAIKRLLGVAVSNRCIPRSDVRLLRIKKSYSTSQNQTHTDFYKIQAVTNSDKALDIGFNLAGRDAAEQVLESLGWLTGYPVK